MTNSLSDLYDVCVIGTGPAGITASLELAERGLSVILIESGTDEYDDSIQNFSDAVIDTQASHSPMSDATRRGLGGTSALWGGRCVPLDTIDFEKRDFIDHSGWPFEAETLSAYYARACEILGVGEANFNTQDCGQLKSANLPLSSNFTNSDTILSTQLERWSTACQIWQAHKVNIESNPRIKILQKTTCIGFCQQQIDGQITEIHVRPSLSPSAKTDFIKARIIVLAAGGVESTRLILNSLRDPLGLKVHSPELVGRFYMGHPSGKLADIQLTGNPSETLFNFEKDSNVYVRRRITFTPKTLREQKLLNIAFWLDNPPLSDWHHKSGVLSAAYLALTTPILGNLLAPSAIRKRMTGEGRTQRLRHLFNCLSKPLSTALFCINFLWKRYFSTPRLPGFFTYSGNNCYALHYHAEQVPSWDSTITLSNETDAHGLLRAKIALRWSAQDIDSIIRAHHTLDHSLQSLGIGQLVYRIKSEDFEYSIREQAVDGFHQIGTLRMAKSSAEGVTDGYGRVYGTQNFFVASSAIFPTSGQANPTLALVALTVRQAEYIANMLKSEEIHA